MITHNNRQPNRQQTLMLLGRLDGAYLIDADTELPPPKPRPGHVRHHRAHSARYVRLLQAHVWCGGSGAVRRVLAGGPVTAWW